MDKRACSLAEYGPEPRVLTFHGKHEHEHAGTGYPDAGVSHSFNLDAMLIGNVGTIVNERKDRVNIVHKERKQKHNTEYLELMSPSSALSFASPDQYLQTEPTPPRPPH